MSSSVDKMVLLKSSDGNSFSVCENASTLSHVIKNLLEDIENEDAIPLPNVRGEVLEKVIEYCHKFVAKKRKYCDNCIQRLNWPAEYAKANQGILLDILLAADYLQIKSLQALMCRTISSMIMGQSSREELRSALNIQGNFDAEEEAHLRRTLTRLGCVVERQD